MQHFRVKKPSLSQHSDFFDMHVFGTWEGNVSKKRADYARVAGVKDVSVLRARHDDTCTVTRSSNKAGKTQLSLFKSLHLDPKMVHNLIGVLYFAVVFVTCLPFLLGLGGGASNDTGTRPSNVLARGGMLTTVAAAAAAT